MRSWTPLLVALVACLLGPLASPRLRAQEGGADKPKADSPKADKSEKPAADSGKVEKADAEDPLARRVRELTEDGFPPDRTPPPARPHDPRLRRSQRSGYYYPPYPYGWYPWYVVPQSYGTKSYPPPITHVPRLGMQYTYLDAYQMGIRIPDDVDPLDVAPNLGPYVGIVGQAKRELAGVAAAQAGGGAGGGGGDAIALMKEGKYKEAGRILAARYEANEDPTDALLLSEVFFGLGKPAHAELLLRQALSADDGADALPDGVASHFPSKDDFERKLQELDSSGEHRLLYGYLRTQSSRPDAGLDVLESLAKKDPKDKAPALLYKRYLSKAFEE